MTMKKILVLILLAGFCWRHELAAQCAPCQYQANLITNGQFTSGNAGFTSELNYATGFFCPLCPENTYTVGINATFYHSDFTGSDHTNPPFGSFYVANGPGESGVNVWCQSFPVQPQTDYDFTFWARDITNNSDVHPYALLQPSFNGIIIDDTLVADGAWESFTFVWNSGSDTFLDLCILNQQSQTGGNDFGLDDISLIACQNYLLSQTASAGEDVASCSMIPVAIGQSSFNGYTYQWNNANGLSSTSIAAPTVTLENSNSGLFTETYILSTDSAGVGCITTDTVTVTILPMPMFSLGSDTTICPGEFATLDVGSGWTHVTWSNSMTSQTIQVDGGAYSATVAYDDCSSTDEVVVNVATLPEMTLGADTSFCESTDLLLQLETEVTWSDNSFSDSLTVVSSGEYFFLYENGFCELSDTILVTMFLQPEFYLPTDSAFCEGEILMLDAGVSGLWNTGLINNSIQIDEPGYYDIVVENGPCLVNSGTMVQMIPAPFLSLSTDSTLCEDSPLALDVYNDRNTYYSWSTGDTTSFTILYESGSYIVYAGNQCDTLSSEIMVETYPCDWGLFVPSCFTPNDDNINEAWMVKGYNISNVEIYIYNRLGDLIFYTPEIGIAWYPSLGIGDDIYNYTIKATAFDGEAIEQHGHIYLLR